MPVIGGKTGVSRLFGFCVGNGGLDNGGPDNGGLGGGALASGYGDAVSAGHGATLRKMQGFAAVSALDDLACPPGR